MMAGVGQGLRKSEMLTGQGVVEGGERVETGLFSTCLAMPGGSWGKGIAIRSDNIFISNSFGI